jgi:hypothetical protein
MRREIGPNKRKWSIHWKYKGVWQLERGIKLKSRTFPDSILGNETNKKNGRGTGT